MTAATCLPTHRAGKADQRQAFVGKHVFATSCLADDEVEHAAHAVIGYDAVADVLDRNRG